MANVRRRRLIGGAAATAALPRRLFAQTLAKNRPQLPQGVQSGDVLPDGGVIWSRVDRPAQMFVDYATTESFSNAQRIDGPLALEPTDFTTRVRINGIPPGQTVFYRVTYLDLADFSTFSEPVVGRFKVPAATTGDVSFVWSGDTAGQGYGINPDVGGMTIYESMRRLSPDFFVHSGDAIYADNPIAPEKKLPDGKVWKNIVTEGKSRVAETLADFRANYRYNFLDDHLRRFAAEVPLIAQWDDHDVLDNWYWQKRLDNDPRYHEKSVAKLAALGQRAFREYMPLWRDLDGPMELYHRFSFGPRLDLFRVDMRSYRGPNGRNLQSVLDGDSAFMGNLQVEWLKGALKESTATWKIIAADMPIGVVVYDDWRTKSGSEAVANGDDGPPLGRELEIAGLLSFIKREGIRNVHWITADVHYPATHRYDPNKAAFSDFLPFYEFVSGPLCAGGFGPNALDRTFGPEIVFQKPAGRPDLAPSEGSCHFGHVKVDGKSGAMTVTHRDAAGNILHALDLAPL
ncbi:MAG TPA: alkaline phosphatase D family protein [Reyranella sp.]|nr:alkaline phosphatase D family protein [Reyranella sp.]